MIDPFTIKCLSQLKLNRDLKKYGVAIVIEYFSRQMRTSEVFKQWGTQANVAWRLKDLNLSESSLEAIMVNSMN